MARIGIMTCSNATQDLGCSSVSCLADLRKRRGMFKEYPADEPLDLVEELRQPLDLVDDDYPIVWAQLLLEPPGITRQREVGSGVEEVVDPVPLHCLRHQEALARLPWPEEEVRLLREQRGEIEYPGDGRVSCR